MADCLALGVWIIALLTHSLADSSQRFLAVCHSRQRDSRPDRLCDVLAFRLLDSRPHHFTRRQPNVSTR